MSERYEWNAETCMFLDTVEQREISWEELRSRLNALERELAWYKDEHNQLCDIFDNGPDGIRKPCNCQFRALEDNANLRRKLAEAYTEASNVAGRAIAEWAARDTMGVEQQPLATRVVRAIRSLITKEADHAES